MKLSQFAGIFVVNRPFSDGFGGGEEVSAVLAPDIPERHKSLLRGFPTPAGAATWQHRGRGRQGAGRGQAGEEAEGLCEAG